MSRPFHFAYPELVPGILVRRYKRFLADVTLEDGELVTAHSTNTGSMTGCAAPGSPVYLSRATNDKRKLRYTWEAVKVGRRWVAVNTLLPNRMVRAAIEAHAIAELRGYGRVRAEVPYAERSRVDLLLEDAKRPPCYVEIKNVTLLAGEGRALFPDAITTRGQKHLRDLMGVVGAGGRAVIFFFIPRADARSFAPADAIDPDYGMLLRQAVEVGVEVLPYRCSVRRRGISLEQRLPLIV